MASDSKKRLALAIHDFLSQSLQDGTLQPEDADSIEVAQNCIVECFHIDPADRAAMQDAMGGQSLLQIYQVYEKLKGKSTASTQGTSSAQEGRPATPTTRGEPNDDSERLKSQGNAAMQRKDFAAAVDAYTKALEVSPLNPIYLSNRAAAFSAKGDHELAKNDAELATATDPKYTKAWSRLGLARFALGDAQGSMEAYQKGIDAEGSGGSEAMKKGFETARRRVEEEGGSTSTPSEEAPRSTSPAAAGGMPDLGGLASMLGGGGAGGGGGGGGGGFDLGSIMQNPMMRQMAQNLMSNPDMMNNLMNNPRLRDMAGRFGGGGAAGGQGGSDAGTGGGGGMPNISELMQDPAMMEMARNFMGGMGGAGGAGRGGGGS